MHGTGESGFHRKENLQDFVGDSQFIVDLVDILRYTLYGFWSMLSDHHICKAREINN